MVVLLEREESFEMKRGSAKFLFCALLIALGLVWIVSFFVNPTGVQSRLFQHAFAPWFGDYFLTRVVWHAPCPYEGVGLTPSYEVIYPLFAYWLLTFFPHSLWGGLLNSVTGGLFLFFSLFVFLRCRLNNMSFWGRLMISAACCCSWQMFYVFERSNQVQFAVGMVVFFLAWYDSKLHWKRCLAAAALATAAALKVTPALFGVLYFVPVFKRSDRWQLDWFSILLCASIASALAFGPLWWHGQGFVEVERLYRNVVANAPFHMDGTSWGPVALWRELSFVGLSPVGFSFRIARLANVVLGVLGIVASILPPRSEVKMYERLLFLASAVMLLPTNSCAYMVLYLFPAFLMTQSDDWKMCALWFALFLPIQIPAELIVDSSGIALNPTISNFAFLGLLALAYCRFVIRAWRLRSGCGVV